MPDRTGGGRLGPDRDGQQQRDGQQDRQIEGGHVLGFGRAGIRSGIRRGRINRVDPRCPRPPGPSGRRHGDQPERRTPRPSGAPIAAAASPRSPGRSGAATVAGRARPRSSSTADSDSRRPVSGAAQHRGPQQEPLDAHRRILDPEGLQAVDDPGSASTSERPAKAAKGWPARRPTSRAKTASAQAAPPGPPRRRPAPAAHRAAPAARNARPTRPAAAHAPPTSLASSSRRSPRRIATGPLRVSTVIFRHSAPHQTSNFPIPGIFSRTTAVHQLAQL